MAYACIAAAILYLIPGFVLLARRPEGKNLSGEAVYTTLLWLANSARSFSGLTVQ